jgi:hypothetical protein
MATIKTLYPASNADSVAITIGLGSLASDTNLLAGRESASISNTSNLDLDHLLSGKIRAGTTPTAGGQIEIWVAAPISIASGTPSWPDVLDGTDSDETLTSARVKASMLRMAHLILVDNVTDRDYFIPPTSIAGLFGGSLPPHWSLFVVHNTGVALNATGGNHVLHYHRVQAQSV